MTFETINAALARCPRLAKPHFAYRMGHETWLGPSPIPVRDELVRVLGAFTFDARLALRTDYATWLEQINALGADVAIQFSPWSTLQMGSDPGDVNTLTSEILVFNRALQRIATFIPVSRVKAVLLDHGPYTVREGDERWNRWLTIRHTSMYGLAKKYFNDAYVDQWQREGLAYSPWATNTYERRNFYTGQEHGDGISVSLTVLPDEGGMRGLLDQSAITPEVPLFAWVFLGGAYRRGITGSAYLDRELAFDPVYAWQLGRDLTLDVYPYDRVERIGLSCDFTTDPNHCVWSHLIAYCWGASGIREELPA